LTQVAFCRLIESAVRAMRYYEHRAVALGMYNRAMSKNIIHVSEAEAANDFASLLNRVRAGAEVVIEHDAQPVAASPCRAYRAVAL